MKLRDGKLYPPRRSEHMVPRDGEVTRLNQTWNPSARADGDSHYAHQIDVQEPSVDTKELPVRRKIHYTKLSLRSKSTGGGLGGSSSSTARDPTSCTTTSQESHTITSEEWSSAADVATAGASSTRRKSNRAPRKQGKRSAAEMTSNGEASSTMTAQRHSRRIEEHNTSTPVRSSSTWSWARDGPVLGTADDNNTPRAQLERTAEISGTSTTTTVRAEEVLSSSFSLASSGATAAERRRSDEFSLISSFRDRFGRSSQRKATGRGSKRRSPRWLGNLPLEENTFHDLSKTSLCDTLESYNDVISEGDALDGEDGFRPGSGQLDLLHHMDHAKWSHFHDRRRDWYLNRWRRTRLVHHWLVLRVWHVVSVTLLSIITTVLFLGGKHPKMSWTRVIQIITEKRRRFMLIIQNTFTHVRYTETIPASEASPKKRRVCLLCCHTCCHVMAYFSVVFFLIWISILSSGMLLKGGHGHSQGQLHVVGSALVDLGSDSASVPAWHVLSPSTHGLPSVKALQDGSPAFLFIRNDGDITLPRRIDVYGNLSSLGYHVVIPVCLSSDMESISLAWAWLKRYSRSSVTYLWADLVAVSEVERVVKVLCQQAVPPSGVFIATAPLGERDETRSIEMWSCNCTSSLPGNSVHSYQNIKCPVSLTSLYSDIVNCLSSLLT